MERCPRCERHDMRHTTRLLTRSAGGRSFTATIEIRRCETCDWSPLPVDAILAHDRAVAIQLALFGPVSTETFRWLRRALDLDLEETSRVVGLDLEKTLQVEHGHATVPVDAWMKLARCVREREAVDVSEASRCA